MRAGARWHESAKAFYTDKLGFEVKTDRRTDDGFRWITVHAADQPDVLLVLGEIAPPRVSEQQAAALRELVAMGTLGVGVLRTDDCRATHDELVARGVEFLQE